MFAIWPGLSVKGKLAPEAAKPVPESLGPLTVTAVASAVDRVSVLVADELTTTLPKSALLVLTLRLDITAPECAAKVAEAPPSPPLSVAILYIAHRCNFGAASLVPAVPGDEVQPHRKTLQTSDAGSAVCRDPDLRIPTRKDRRNRVQMAQKPPRMFPCVRGIWRL
jgi:hypothetical protein